MASSCDGCASAGNCPSQENGGCSEGPKSMLEALNEYSSIKKVIGVVSGKGGVGKSFVTASLASAMRKNRNPRGILAADITGTSIPKKYALHAPAVGSEMGVCPIEAADGVKVMSVNLLMDDEEAPVIWRGPIIAGTVKQFWTD
ncbi:MAG: Mrp/NBP35 family ATP-binding protein, partial [Clostridiales bacterium]|nr:Mrp/NBP35 family ATP-binding protein [Clostridiales bacterium]